MFECGWPFHLILQGSMVVSTAQQNQPCLAWSQAYQSYQSLKGLPEFNGSTTAQPNQPESEGFALVL